MDPPQAAARGQGLIPVARRAEPLDFDEKVRSPGMQWLAEKLGGERSMGRRGRPVAPVAVLKPSEIRDFWTACLGDLRREYDGCCAYAGIEIREGGGTVDHFVAKSLCLDDPERRRLIFDWSNYRFAFLNVNRRKGDRVVLDPFELRQGWFELEFVGLQVVPRDSLEPANAQLVRDAIENLGLNDDWLRDLRVGYFDAWDRGEIALTYLRRYAPFIALEIERMQLAPRVAPA